MYSARHAVFSWPRRNGPFRKIKVVPRIGMKKKVRKIGTEKTEWAFEA